MHYRVSCTLVHWVLTIRGNCYFFYPEEMAIGCFKNDGTCVSNFTASVLRTSHYWYTLNPDGRVASSNGQVKYAGTVSFQQRSTDCVRNSLQLVYIRNCVIILATTVFSKTNVTLQKKKKCQSIPDCTLFAEMFSIHQDIIPYVNIRMTSGRTFLWRNIAENRGKEFGVESWVLHRASYGGLKEKKKK